MEVFMEGEVSYSFTSVGEFIRASGSVLKSDITAVYVEQIKTLDLVIEICTYLFDDFTQYHFEENQIKYPLSDISKKFHIPKAEIRYIADTCCLLMRFMENITLHTYYDNNGNSYLLFHRNYE